MREPKTAEEAYDTCAAGGAFSNNAQPNRQKLLDLVENAEITIESAESLKKIITKQDRRWMNVYILYYEALRIYTEALISTDNKKIHDHKCLFAYLCVKYPNLELDWNFFEKVRTKRNGANYYGEKIMYDDWKAIEIQINLYISTLRKEVENKLSES